MIRIVLPPDPEEHVAITVSPLLECVLSLHVLVGPKHHALQHAWVRRSRSLPAELRRDVATFAFAYRAQIPDVFLPGPDDEIDGFEAETARLRALAPELLLDGLGRPLYDHGGAGAAVFGDPGIRRAALAQGGRAAERLLDDPAAFAAALADFLDRYWQASFGSEWERIEGLLSRAIVQAGRTLATGGVWPVLGRLPQYCRLASGRELAIDLPHEHTVEVGAARPLVLVPSTFVWPHLRISCDLPWPLAIVYTAPELACEAEPRVPQAELLRALRAVADDTRLRVLKLIAERPRTTQELEPIVGLSRAGLSKSLQRLAEVGLISPRREGYYVVYSLDRARYDALAAALAGYLGDHDYT
jgi:DNA-binding transcriptional ArsR family regulator